MSEKTTLDRLIYMANQIARNLQTDDDPVGAMVTHLHDFWDPRMKAMITAYRGDALSPTAQAAVARLGA